MEAWWTLVVLAAGLASDAGAVAIASAIRARRVPLLGGWSFACWCAAFQGVMPAIGYAGAWVAGPWLAEVDHWLAMAILGGIGGKLVYEGARAAAETTHAPWPGQRLQITLAFATSIDALAAGVTLPVIGLGLLRPVLAIAGLTLLIVVLGAFGGRHLSVGSGRWAGVAGGVLLILIGVHILVAHLTAG